MSDNKTQDALERRFINEIADIRRQLRALSTPQAIGADILQVESIPAADQPPLLAGPFVVPANGSDDGNFVYVLIELAPGLGKSIQITPLVSMYIGAVDNAHLWPNGSALSVYQKASFFVLTDDEARYDPETGNHTIIVQLVNYNLVADNFYVTSRMLLPKVGTGGSIS